MNPVIRNRLRDARLLRHREIVWNSLHRSASLQPVGAYAGPGLPQSPSVGCPPGIGSSLDATRGAVHLLVVLSNGNVEMQVRVDASRTWRCQPPKRTIVVTRLLCASQQKAPSSLALAAIGHLALLGSMLASDRRSLTGAGTVEWTALRLDPCGDHSTEHCPLHRERPVIGSTVPKATNEFLVSRIRFARAAGDRRQRGAPLRSRYGGDDLACVRRPGLLHACSQAARSTVLEAETLHEKEKKTTSISGVYCAA